MFSKRQNGGGKCNGVGAAFGGKKKSELAIKSGNQDGIKYVKTLEDCLLPISDVLLVSWHFMLDGAPCHRANIA